IDQFSTGAKRIGNAEGTWRDAEDGQLSRNPIAQGSVDSTVGFNMHLTPHGSGEVVYWIAAGRTYDDIKDRNRTTLTSTAERMMDRAEASWRLWACKRRVDSSPLPEPLRDLYIRSQIILRCQIDHSGAIIAANDPDITHCAGDTDSYLWPR